MQKKQKSKTENKTSHVYPFPFSKDSIILIRGAGLQQKPVGQLISGAGTCSPRIEGTWGTVSVGQIVSRHIK